MTPDRPGLFLATCRRLVRLLMQERLRCIAVLCLTVATVCLTALGPALIGRAVDIVFAGVVASPGVNFDALAHVLSLIFVVAALAALAEFVQGWLLNDVATSTSARLRRAVQDKVHRLPLRQLDSMPRGELLSRVTNDVDNLSRTLSQALSQLMTATLTATAVLVMMLRISPTLTLVALVAVPLSALITRLVMRQSQRHFVQQWTHTGALNAHIEDAFTGHEVIRAFGRQSSTQAAFDDTNEALRVAGQKAQFLSGLLNPIMVLVGNLAYVVICVVGALRVMGGQLSLGGLVSFVQYSQQLTAPLSQIASMTNMVQSGLASAERVFDLLDLPEEDVTERGHLPQPITGKVCFEQVTFNYGEGPLIEGLDLVAEPGHTVAIVGPTGAGKSTVVNLLMRFYEPLTGRITLDGTDIATVPRQQLRSRIGMVLQDTWLFQGTIRDNIAFGLPNASDDDVRRAAKAARIDHIVQALPRGYDTVLDESGDILSEGERQLVTIARAFIANPDILVLDEATSAVDSRTEALIQEAMATLRAGRTVFVIAHRLSTIRDANLIVAMRDGQIVEMGTHDELLARDGLYVQLHGPRMPDMQSPAPAFAGR